MPVLPSYKNQSIGLHYKPTDWFLYDSSIAVRWVNSNKGLLLNIDE